MLQTVGATALALPCASADPQTVLAWAEFYAFTMRWVLQPIHKYMGLDDNGRKVCSCELTGKKWPRCTEDKPGKHPWRGQKQAPMETPEQSYSTFRSIFDQYPHGVNIGIRTGRVSGIWAMDLDVKSTKNGFVELEKWLTTQKLSWADLGTLSAKTGGGGGHLVFSYPQTVDKMQNAAPLAAVGPAVDVRGDGGYILVAPSVHASGGSYVWQNEIKPGVTCTAPQALIDVVRKKKHSVIGSLLVDVEYTPSAEELREFASILSGKRSDFSKRTGKALIAALEGRAAADAGERYTVFRNIVFAVRREWPRCNKEEILDHLEDSVQLCFPEADAGRLLEIRATIGKAFDDAASAGADDDDWIKQISTNEEGKPIANDPNMFVLFKNHPSWRGVIGFNIRRQTPVYRRKPPIDVPASDFDATRDKTKLALWLQNTAEMSGHIKTEEVRSAVICAAMDNSFDPLLDYINKIRGTWDGVQRLETAMQRVAGTPDSAWVRLVFPVWFRSLVARIIKPGHKVDTMLILEGLQGFKKSTFFSSLMPDSSFFSDSIPRARLDRDTIRMIHSGPAIFELGELSGLKKQEVEDVKAFLSAFQDDLEPKYQSHRTALRRCVFVGTTNRNDYLRDETGARRFWPLRVTRVIDVATVQDERDQWFAEALSYLEAGWPWWLTDGHETALAAEEQDERHEEDIWEEPIRVWLARKATPESTSAPTTATADMEAQMNKLLAGDFVTTMQVAQNALKLEIKNARSIEGFRINKLLKRLGWSPCKHKDTSTGHILRSWKRPQLLTNNVSGTYGTYETPNLQHPLTVTASYQ